MVNRYWHPGEIRYTCFPALKLAERWKCELWRQKRETELLCSNICIFTISLHATAPSDAPQRKSKTNISDPVRSQMSLGRTHFVVNSTQNEMRLIKKDQRETWICMLCTTHFYVLWWEFLEKNHWYICWLVHLLWMQSLFIFFSNPFQYQIIKSCNRRTSISSISLLCLKHDFL